MPTPRVTCPVWSPVEGVADGGTCGEGLHGGTPSLTDCGACPRRRQLVRRRPGFAKAARLDRSKWPKLARAVAWLRRPEDIGVGDTVARLAAVAGGDTLADWYQRIVGADCGCRNRQAGLNHRYPYT